MRILHVGDDHASIRPCGLTYYSEALMKAQAAAGHAVAYVFSGRVYPVGRPRIKRWSHGDVQMIELINARSASHWDLGTAKPSHDLADRAGEHAFTTALTETRPDVVHIHEMARLPSSIIDIAVERGVPVVATLHDYKPLCAAVRLVDAGDQRCLRHEVGADCARNCRGAPDSRHHLIDLTLRHERRRVPVLRDWEPPAARPPRPARDAEPPAAYQRRRDVNLERLNRCARLFAPSARVAEIYAELGVDPALIDVQRLTVPHLERLRPRRGPDVGHPLTFVAPGSAASPTKGSWLLTEALEQLHRDRVPHVAHVLGHVEPVVAARLAGLPSVRLRGVYGLDELPGLLEAGDVGLMTSTWEEAHGFVGIELLAMGLPVIGNALGGIPEYVREGETGWLNHDASATGLAELMAAAVADPSRVVELRRRLRERRDEITRPMADHAGEVAAAYDELRPAGIRR